MKTAIKRAGFESGIFILEYLGYDAGFVVKLAVILGDSSFRSTLPSRSFSK
jgi:hypothetical protein